MNAWQQVLDFEPFLRLLDITAEMLGPDDVKLRLSPRREIANHLGGVHGGAQFTLGESTALTAAVFSLGNSIKWLCLQGARRFVIRKLLWVT